MKHQVVPFVIRHPHPPRALSCVSVYILVRLDAGWRMADGIVCDQFVTHPEREAERKSTGRARLWHAVPAGANGWRMPDGTNGCSPDALKQP